MERVVLLSMFTVTNTIDDGSPGSLRWAITQSNATAGANTIDFSIAASGVRTIAITSALPAVTVPLTIDGTSEPGYSSTPLIELNGSGAGTNVDGLDIVSGRTTVEGLAIDGFSGEGVSLSVAGRDVIRNDFIGTDPSGAIARGNGLDGIVIVSNSNANTIQNDLISGNVSNGIYLRGDALGVGAATSFNLIVGNRIGTDVTGMLALANGKDGVYLQNAPVTTIGGTTAATRNIISGNTRGLELYGNSDGSVVEGNYIGLDVSGSQPLGNGAGITLRGISNSTIGGTAAGAGNVISANRACGIDSVVTSSGNLAIQGNLIGTDSTGTTALGNLFSGIRIAGESDVTIGGTVAGARNVISGNGDDGIDTSGTGPGLLIQGNHIGTDITGTQALGNGGDGIHATFDGITIGGTAAGAGNVIANNGFSDPFDKSGVVISGKFTSVLSNSIYNNEKLGIELVGGNQSSGAPVISAAFSKTSTISVAGILQAAPVCTLQLFSISSLNASGNAEGATLLGTASVTNTGDSIGFAIDLNQGLAPGTLITATETDPYGNTSAFSAPFRIIGTVDGSGPPTIVAQAVPPRIYDGQLVFDTFVISNPFSVADAGLVFTDPEPAGTGYLVGTTSTGVTLTSVNGGVTCALGTLLGGESISVSVSMLASVAGMSTITNVGSVSASTPVVPPGTDTASATTGVIPASELSVQIFDEAGFPPPPPPAAGENLDYYVEVTNNGINADTNVTVQDILPAGVPFSSASTSQGTVSEAGGVVTANLGTVTHGNPVTVFIHLRPTAVAIVTDSAMVSGDLPDTNPANNQATIYTSVSPAVDLYVAISDGGGLTPILDGGNLDYRVSVSNYGILTNDVILRDTLPAGATYLGASTPQGTVTQAGGVVTANLGLMGIGATVVVTIHVRPTAPGAIGDSATATGDQPDPLHGVYQATLTDIVQPAAGLSVAVSTSAPRAVAGSDFTYTAVVTNAGPDPATGVTLTDVLPANAAPGLFTVTQGTVTYSAASGQLAAAIGTLAAHASATLVFHVRASKVGTLVDSASVTADQGNLTPAAAAASLSSAVVKPSIQGDFDGDGRADVAVYGKDPNDGNKYDFRILTSSSGYQGTLIFDNHGYGFGNAQSIPVPADYFGDGRSAYAVWYPNGRGGMNLTAVSSVTGKGLNIANFGGPDDIPVVSDVDGDGKADFGVYGFQAGLGYRFDFLLSSKNFDINQQDVFNNGGYGYGNAQAIPVVADFDGSGKAGFGLYVPSAAGSTFYYVNPASGVIITRTDFGGANDIPTAIDYDGDGKAELSLYGPDPAHPGRYRYAVLTSSSGYSTAGAVRFDNGGNGYGNSTSVPVVADYDGTGKADFGVYVADSKGGMEFVYQTSQTGGGVVLDFANPTDLPLTAPTYLIARKVRGH